LTILADFITSVTATAFRGSNTEQSDAVKATEKAFRVHLDRSFWDRYLGARPQVDRPPVGSFAMPREAADEFRAIVHANSFLACRTTQVNIRGPRDAVETIIDVTGARRLHMKPTPFMGFARAPIADFKKEPGEAPLRLVRNVARAFGQFLDQGFIAGTGDRQPLGIINSAAAITVPRALKHQDAVGTIRDAFSLYKEPDNSCLWLASSSIKFWDLLLLFGDIPYAFTDLMPTLLAANCLMLVDPREYLSAVRWDLVDVAAAVSNGIDVSLMFSFYATGAPRWAAPKVHENGELYVSPFVGLAAEAM